MIWRRALIPYGITFSVLAYLLNEIMELEQPDFFQMKFTDERVYLRESKKVGPADFHTEIWYDIRNAKNTFIEDYFTEGTWFSYSYGTEKEYRVEIEKIESDTELRRNTGLRLRRLRVNMQSAFPCCSDSAERILCLLPIRSGPKNIPADCLRIACAAIKTKLSSCLYQNYIAEPQKPGSFGCLQ